MWSHSEITARSLSKSILSALLSDLQIFPLLPLLLQAWTVFMLFFSPFSFISLSFPPTLSLCQTLYVCVCLLDCVYVVCVRVCACMRVCVCVCACVLFVGAWACVFLHWGTKAPTCETLRWEHTEEHSVLLICSFCLSFFKASLFPGAQRQLEELSLSFSSQGEDKYLHGCETAKAIAPRFHNN